MQQLLSRNATLDDINDVDVEDVDDDKEGTEANFFWSETGMVRRHLAWEHARFPMPSPIFPLDGT